MFFEKWRRIFADMTRGLKSAHRLFFNVESQNALLKLVTTQKRPKTPFQIKYGPKMLRFWKMTSENIKNWETSRYLSNFKLLEVICNEF